ncbi:hypothetical protein FB45DRAFT_1130237, partial [Roridomyces roridus]
DSDVTFRSSDNILFLVHRKNLDNLDVCAGGFPPSEMASTEGEVVELTETSTTLELLFQFMYPQQHPALDITPFEVLEPLAEAAEKYQVFPAMNICHIRMRDMVHDNPVAVAAYAAKHDYPFHVSEVAPMMISMPALQVIEMLPPHLILPWVRYKEEWQHALEDSVKVEVANATHSQHRNGSKGFYEYEDTYAPSAFICMSRLARNISSLRDLDTVLNVEVQYDCCRQDLSRWRTYIEERIAKIPKFSTFL